MTRNKSFESQLVYIYVIILTVTSGIYYFWSSHFVLWFNLLGAIIPLLMYKSHHKNVKFTHAITLFFIFYLYSSLYQYGNVSLSLRVLRFLPFFLFLADDGFMRKTMKVLIVFFAIILIPSIINYIIVEFLGINLPYKVIDPGNKDKMYFYYAYPFMVSDGFPRFHAYFDEPGLLGTYMGVLMIANKCDFKDWKNWIFFVAGVLSTSKFFYLIVIVYLVLWGNKQNRLVLAIIIIGIVAFVVFSGYSVYVEDVYNAFGVTEEYKGDRVSEAFVPFYDKFLHSSDLWFGFGVGACSTKLDQGGCSYKHILVDSGLIMFVTYILGMMLFYISKCGVGKKFFIFFILFIAYFYQRPTPYGLFGAYLLIAPICFYQDDDTTRKRVCMHHR